MKKETFSKEIKFMPAWDRRNPTNPKEDYGIHSAEVFFILRGTHGAVTFVIFTGWHLPHVEKELKTKLGLSGPSGADISYHSLKETKSGLHRKNCQWLDNKPCWSDGSGLAAEEFLKVLIAEGSDAVWKKMEKWYYISVKYLKETR